MFPTIWKIGCYIAMVLNVLSSFGYRFGIGADQDFQKAAYYLIMAVFIYLLRNWNDD